MPRRNDIDVAIAEIVGEYSALKKATKNSDNPKIGMENIDINTAASRFSEMSPSERKTTMKSIGPQETMKIVRHLRGKDGSN